MTLSAPSAPSTAAQAMASEAGNGDAVVNAPAPAPVIEQKDWGLVILRMFDILLCNRQALEDRIGENGRVIALRMAFEFGYKLYYGLQPCESGDSRPIDAILEDKDYENGLRIALEVLGQHRQKIILDLAPRFEGDEVSGLLHWAPRVDDVFKQLKDFYLKSYKAPKMKQEQLLWDDFVQECQMGVPLPVYVPAAHPPAPPRKSPVSVSPQALNTLQAAQPDPPVPSVSHHEVFKSPANLSKSNYRQPPAFSQHLNPARFHPYKYPQRTNPIRPYKSLENTNPVHPYKSLDHTNFIHLNKSHGIMSTNLTPLGHRTSTPPAGLTLESTNCIPLGQRASNPQTGLTAPTPKPHHQSRANWAPRPKSGCDKESGGFLPEHWSCYPLFGYWYGDGVHLYPEFKSTEDEDAFFEERRKHREEEAVLQATWVEENAAWEAMLAPRQNATKW
ncbi:hypothetical protein Q8F55_002487 [Vanrija albida]|uniref:Uncharacterized protein n=1 Tax=Vanrija albida TaxID=181172 RepID=A0ABR3QAU7_9TREE